MNTKRACGVRHVINWIVPVFLLGGLLYLFYDDYRDNKTATEEQLLALSHEIPCAGEAFRKALLNNPKPLTLRAVNKIASECGESEKQLKALNGINK
ncbi:hypothetical protein electrica_05475 (plasmid) [Klebsiella electrica]|uniref:hypothetical protein n=1 Tax=Klebsiella electrica TaxID=1259973 RepID=UPI0011532A1B|nr:hypothetical protein [Klebsiella electrica]QDI11454.1 hypothetical protein electrica_05475 [Klebsiella electrica]HBT5239948.1 hypothetical protein [Klebsiella quasipneumoniae]